MNSATSRTARRATARTRTSAMLSAALVAGFGLAVVMGATPADAAGALSVADMNHGTTAAQLAQQLAGAGVTISNVTYTGAPNAAGTFSGGTGIIGFDSGIVLGTGSVQSTDTSTPCSKGVEGPNQCDGNSTDNGQPGDPALDTLAGYSTYDAAVLQFDFVPAASTVQFSYVFSSDEYPEYANTEFNDAFGFFVNGANCALVPGTNLPVSINTINGGNPLGTDPQNPQYYVDNSTGTLNTEMDGLTTVLTCTASVNAGQTNHMKLAIADGSDYILDSNVFLEAASLVSGTQISTVLSGGGQSGSSITVPSGTAVTDQATLAGDNITTAGGTVTYAAYTDANCTQGETSAGSKTVTDGSVAASDPLTLAAGTYYWQASYSGDGTHNPTSSCNEVLTVQAAANQPPTITGASGTVVYSDPITPFNVTYADPDAGDTLTVTASGLPAGLSLTDNHNGTATVSGTDTAVPGSYPVTYTVNDGHNPDVTAQGVITVTKETCVLTQPTTLLGSASSSTTLTANFGENDTSFGDRTGKTVHFTVTDTGTNAVVFTGDGATASNGDVSVSAPLTAGVYSYAVSFAGDDYYLSCATAAGAETIVTVAPAAFKVTGGGWFVSTGRTSFGFNAWSDVAGLHGQIQIRTAGKSRFHGDVVLSLSGSGNTATWTGTGKWNGVGGYTFSVTVVDNGTSGKKGDTISVVIKAPNGSTVFSSGGPQPLKGGNIVVH